MNRNRNSALIWLPAIEAAGLPCPHTVIVPYDHYACAAIFDGETSEEFMRLTDAVMEAGRAIGFPVFIRTDLSSAKHSGIDALCISADGHNQPIFETLEDNELKFWMEKEWPTAFLVRKFLTLDAPFTAFRGLPIAREFRFFADETQVYCWHPYWPEFSIEDHRPSCENWRELLAELNTTPPPAELSAMAVRAAAACGGGRWSVDFCRDVDGKWWLPDMAREEDSFHWEGCPNGKAEA